MAKVTPARRAALEVLRAVRSGELLDPAFARRVEQVPARDRAWTQELVYGVLRLRGRIDQLLAAHVRRGLTSLDPDILDTLRLGAYQLLQMDSVPPYAAISQATEMGKAVAGRGAGGLVNGVLQSLLRSLHERPPAPDDADLSGWGSHPDWLVRRWRDRYGDDVRRLVQLDNTRPDVYIRPLRVSAEEALGALQAAGIAAERVAHAPDALRLPGGSAIREALAVVDAVVQDPAAGLVVRYAAFEPGTIADLAAAPGGKTLEIAAGPDRRVIAVDISPGRLARVRENAERTGAGNVYLVAADSRQPPLVRVDHVLLDAPCTGTGTFRRHPDGKWRVQPSDLDVLAQLQRELLESAATLVRPGGLLVYSTCSLEPEENEEQVRRFLDTHPNFRMEASNTVEREMLNEEGMLVITPQRYGFDGAFAARMRKAGS